MPPQSLEAERAVLGAALLDAEAAALLPTVPPEAFYKEAHRDLARAIQRLLGRGEAVDALTVAEELRRQDRFEAVGGHAYLAVLQDEGTVATQVPAYLAHVREYAVRREFIRQAREAADAGYDLERPLTDLIGDHVTACVRLESEHTPQQVLSPAEFAREMRIGSDPTRIPTGLAVLDVLAGGGLTVGDLTIIAGRPGIGKTVIGVQLNHHITTVLGYPTLFLSLEMTRRQIGKRYLSFASLEQLEQSGFYIADPSAPTIAALSAMVRRMVTQHAVQVVVIDHLRKIKPTRPRERHDLEVAEVVYGLRDLAKTLDISVVALCHLSRFIERRADPRPVLSDLAESRAIEEEAAVVLIAWSPEERKIGKDPLPIVLSLDKNRHGPTGDYSYTFHKSRGRIEEATR